MNADNAERRNVSEYLRDILAAIAHVRGFVADMEFDAFATDVKTNFAVVRALEMLGEAAKQIPPDVRALAPDIVWRPMAAMRDKLIHDYPDVQLEIVWKTIHGDLPDLEPKVQRLLRELTGEAP